MPTHSYSFAMVNARFPHVGQLIREHWSQPLFNDFMRELLEQDPKRQGFPTGIISALHAVALEHYMNARSNTLDLSAPG